MLLLLSKDLERGVEPAQFNSYELLVIAVDGRLSYRGELLYVVGNSGPTQINWQT